MQARKEEKLRKAQQLLLESKQSKSRTDDEALDASLDQVRRLRGSDLAPLQSTYFFDDARMHVLPMVHRRL
jgi:hypothetical protein